jgi:hypothetical protein
MNTNIKSVFSIINNTTTINIIFCNKNYIGFEMKIKSFSSTCRTIVDIKNEKCYYTSMSDHYKEMSIKDWANRNYLNISHVADEDFNAIWDINKKCNG